MLFRKNMPESLWKPSFPPAMDSLQFEIIPEESSSELEDEDDLSLLALPEICIPPPLFTPLPLQCLAASALPDGVKREIESVTASVADLRGSSVFSQSSSEPEDKAPISGAEPTLDTAEKRIVVSRDTVQTELVDDLGIGVRISGGVRCRSCGILHAIVTAVNRNSTHSSEIHEGMCVVEWCGQSLLGATFEQTRKILGCTRGEMVEMVVKECGGRRQSKDTNRSCNIFLDFTALSVNVRTLTADPSSKDEQTENGNSLAPSPDHALPVSGSKIRRSLSSYLVREMDSPSARKPSGRPSSAHLPVQSEAMEEDDEEDSPSHELSFPLPSFGVPKTPTILPDDMFDDFFSSLPSGMIKLSLSYDEGQERLRIILSQVKARSSREVNDSSGVFINTYLIPNLRSQGAKFAKAAVTPSDIQNAPMYSIKKDEIESTALRVVLWDTPRKGSATFRGEVLLSLSDDEIVNLDGDPAWYTVCPEDPNLPHLPVPIMHRGKQRERVEHLFNRVKQTLNHMHGPTQALSYLKQYTSKALISGGGNVSLESAGSIDLSSSKNGSTSSLPSMRRRRSIPGKKRHRDRFGSMPRKHLLRLGKSQEAVHQKPTPAENSTTSVREESQRLSKLINILHVLRREDSCLESSIDAIDSHPAEEERKARLQTILTVLKEPEASESSPVDSPDAGYLQVPTEDSDFSTLDRRNRKRSPKPAAGAASKPSHEPQGTENGRSSFSIPHLAIATSEELDDEARSIQSSNPKSHSLPLQDSAAGEELQSSHPKPDSELGEAQSTEGSPAIDPKIGSFSVIPGLRGSLNAGKTLHKVSVYSFLSESDGARDSLNSQEEVRLSAHTSSGQQQHYQLVDEYQTDDELEDKTDDTKTAPSDSSSSMHASKKNHTVVTRTDSDCSCYSVNINIGKQEETAPTTNRFSQASLNPPALQLADRSIRVSKKRKSRSVGDILDLDSDDEVPFEQSPEPPSVIEGCPALPEGNECEEQLADAEFVSRPQCSLKLPPTQPPAAPNSGRGRAASLFSRIPWVKKKGARKQTLRSKWGSLDNLIETVPSRSRSRKERRGSQQYPTTSSSSSTLLSENGKTPGLGSLSLELCYDLQNPLLTMTLADMIFLPTKGLTSDVTVKAQLFHNSTRVCLLKRKANFSLKKNTAPPLASFQFEIDITNLALQVSLVSGSRLFSKKSSGQVWIDLNTLQLQQNQHCSQWFQLSKTV